MSETVKLTFRRANDTVQEVEGAVGDDEVAASGGSS